MYRTPIEKLENLSSCNIYIKRDDLIPFSFGGNKVRIAQEYFEDMARKKKNCIIGYGSSKSNLCRVISNMAYSKNIPCIIISPNENDGSRVESNNSFLVKSCNAKYIICKKDEVASTIEKTLIDCEKNNLNPYYINGNKYGTGNEAIPVNAYKKVYDEIIQQCKELNIVFDYIFLATGTGMTQAGLISGQIVSGGSEKIIGISVARNRDVESNVIRKYITSYLNEVENLTNYEINIIDEYLCNGYGCYDDSIIKIINTIYKNYGIPLDTTYTGKAFNGMLKFIEANKINKKNILFIHTGGTPLFFDNIHLLNK